MTTALVATASRGALNAQKVPAEFYNAARAAYGDDAHANRSRHIGGTVVEGHRRVQQNRSEFQDMHSTTISQTSAEHS